MYIGVNMRKLLDFAESYPDKWHTFNGIDRATVNAVHSLDRLGLIEVNYYRQFRLLTR